MSDEGPYQKEKQEPSSFEQSEIIRDLPQEAQEQHQQLIVEEFPVVPNEELEQEEEQEEQVPMGVEEVFEEMLGPLPQPPAIQIAPNEHNGFNHGPVNNDVQLQHLVNGNHQLQVQNNANIEQQVLEEEAEEEELEMDVDNVIEEPPPAVLPVIVEPNQPNIHNDAQPNAEAPQNVDID